MGPEPASCGSEFLRSPAAALSHDMDGQGSRARRPGRVMIVEDESFAALSSEDALSDAGFVVVGVAATAEQAIEMAGAERPDIVLMDVRLAGPRDGIDAAAEILERFAIPSVFATAQADAGTRTRGELAARPLAWLLKPFAPNELVVAVGAALAIKR